MSAPSLNNATISNNGLNIILTFNITTTPLIPINNITGLTFKTDTETIIYPNNILRTANDTITITLNTPIFIGQNILFSYNNGNITDSNNIALQNITNQPITNNSNILSPKIPTYYNSYVTTDGSEIIVNFTEVNNIPILPATNLNVFTVYVNGIINPIYNSTRSTSTQVTLRLLNPIPHSAKVLLSYMQGNITDNTGNYVYPFERALVINNSTVAPTPQLAIYTNGNDTSAVGDFLNALNILTSLVNEMNTSIDVLDDVSVSNITSMYGNKFKHMRNNVINSVNAIEQIVGAFKAITPIS